MMTNKEKCIHNLQQARTSHIRWLNSIKLLISGVEMDEQSMKPLPTESRFGQWFYDEAMHFSQPICQMSLEEIDTLLSAIYDEYTKIYLIYFGEGKGGFKSMFGLKHKVNRHEAELSGRYYEEVLKYSDQLKKKLRVFESQLMSLSDDKFDALAAFSMPEAMPVAEIEKENSDDGYLYGGRIR